MYKVPFSSKLLISASNHFLDISLFKKNGRTIFTFLRILTYSFSQYALYNSFQCQISVYDIIHFTHKDQIIPSLIAVQGAPSSCSNRISFNATKFSVNLLLPLYTVAYVPYKIHFWKTAKDHKEYICTTYKIKSINQISKF